MKIAFDFDDTLTDPRMQILAKMLVQTGNEVWIITARNEKGIKTAYFDMIRQASGINPCHVIHTTEGPKHTWLDNMGFDVFIDNDKREIIEAASYTSCLPLHFFNEL